MFSLDNIMSVDLVTLNPSSSLDRARSLMEQKRVRHLPVVNDHDELVGLVTQTDVYAAMDSILRDSDSRLPVEQFPVEDIMVTDISTVGPEASIREAAMYLEKHRFGCLPITENGRLVGIITDTDFVGVAINLLEQIELYEPESESFAEDV